jgi:hypothetical protein
MKMKYESKAKNLFKVTQIDFSNDYENIDLEMKTRIEALKTEDGKEMSKCNISQDNFEFDFNFLPPKRDFFLYTITEHENLTKKTFSFKKKNKNLKVCSVLSKSDSNLYSVK